MIDLVVFDWDGTLMDSADRIVHCMQNAARDCGHTPPSADAVRDIIGLSLTDAFTRLVPGIDSQGAAQLAAGYREHWLSSDAIAMPLFDGVEPGLARLTDAGFMLGVATGKARRGLDRALEQSGLGPIFTATRGADEARPKPDPAMLLALLDETGVMPDRCVMVGDTSYDMSMAVSARVEGVGVSWGSHQTDTLVNAGADRVFDRFEALVEALVQRGPRQ